MAKAPAFQLYVRDWLTDEALARCGPEARGVWIDLLCHFWLAPQRGILTNLDYEQVARLTRSTPVQAERAVKSLTRHGVAEVVLRRGKTPIKSIENRRMVREQAIRDRDKERQRRHRQGSCHADVTPPSASASASASACKKEGDSPLPPSADFGGSDGTPLGRAASRFATRANAPTWVPMESFRKALDDGWSQEEIDTFAVNGPTLGGRSAGSLEVKMDQWRRQNPPKPDTSWMTKGPSGD